MSETKKVVINGCFGGFGLSEAAYEKLIEWGVPAKRYDEQDRDEATGLFKPRDDGEVIYDRELTPLGESTVNDIYHRFKPNYFGGRYWDCWTRENREHPLIVRLVEEMGEAVNSMTAKLCVVEIPADVEYEISEYDGNEHIAETHRTWR